MRRTPRSVMSGAVRRAGRRGPYRLQTALFGRRSQTCGQLRAARVKKFANACRSHNGRCTMRPTRFPPPGLVRFEIRRSSAHGFDGPPLSRGVVPVLGSTLGPTLGSSWGSKAPRTDPAQIRESSRDGFRSTDSGRQGLDRPTQGSRRHDQLALGFVHRCHDVVAVGPEERLGDGRHALAVAFDGVGDHAQLGQCRRSIGARMRRTDVAVGHRRRTMARPIIGSTAANPLPADRG